MITLHGAGAGFGLPEISPFVTKSEVQLKMAGLAYRKQPARPMDSPKGQIPFIDDGSSCIADSSFIRAHLEHAYGVDFDQGLDLAQRAQAWTIERMIEHHLYWALVGARWINAENFAKGPANFFNDLPDAQRDAIRAGAREAVTHNYLVSGLGRHTPDEALELAGRSLMALSLMLADKLYLMGDRPCGADATAFAILAGIMTPYFDSPLRTRLLQFGNLTAYVDRMMAQFYPEHAWQCAAEAA
jgi:glutathione S-transferase